MSAGSDTREDSEDSREATAKAILPAAAREAKAKAKLWKRELEQQAPAADGLLPTSQLAIARGISPFIYCTFAVRRKCLRLVNALAAIRSPIASAGHFG